MNAGHLIVQGVIEGNVDVGRIEIKETGHVSGVISSTEMIIEAKGVFEGESHIKGAVQTKSEKADPAPKKEQK